MYILFLLLIIFGLLLFLATYLKRRNEQESTPITINENPECCGAHEVCDKDTLLNANAQAEYFDDEELDAFSGISPENYTESQLKAISEVFYSLPEDNVAAWLRSLQLRHIGLPAHIREQALMIVSERRGKDL